MYVRIHTFCKYLFCYTDLLKCMVYFLFYMQVKKILRIVQLHRVRASVCNFPFTNTTVSISWLCERTNCWLRSQKPKILNFSHNTYECFCTCTGNGNTVYIKTCRKEPSSGITTLYTLIYQIMTSWSCCVLGGEHGGGGLRPGADPQQRNLPDPGPEGGLWPAGCQVPHDRQPR